MNTIHMLIVLCYVCYEHWKRTSTDLKVEQDEIGKKEKKDIMLLPNKDETNKDVTTGNALSQRAHCSKMKHAILSTLLSSPETMHLFISFI